jgi:hypothetical protein
MPFGRVRFGMALDGERGWHGANSLGSAIVGPLGLLSLLEAQLGIFHLVASQAVRVVQYGACLRAARNGARFYEKSFEADELGTSRMLLGWRDQWYEAGWTGVAVEGAKGRVSDMAHVEEAARGKVAPGVGERLLEIAQILDRRRPAIEEIELIEPLSALHVAWQRVLTKLRVTEAKALAPQARPGSQLRKLQDALLAAKDGQKPSKIEWKEDGTVRVVRAETRLAGADWLAAELREASGDALVVVGQDGGIVDAALAVHDIPRLGTSSSTPFRPSLQLLPLALRLLWEPLDLGVLLEFLTLPNGPLPRGARNRMAERIAETPGIGGSAWQALVVDLEKTYAEKKAPTIGEEVGYWTGGARHAPSDGAPIAVVLERARRIAAYFQVRLGEEDETRLAAWTAGFAQASAVCDALEALELQGRSTIGPDALDRLVAQATGSGSTNPFLRAEAGSRCVVSDPAAVIEPFGSVYWWQMTTVPLPRPYPWTTREEEELRASGVELRDVGQLLAATAREWLKPILAAKDQLTLMLPGEGVENHPAWVRVASLLKDPPVATVEGAFTGEEIKGRTSAVAFRPLPALRRWWRLPAGIGIPPPQRSSFSSLEKLIFNPYQWVLGYPAHLRESALLSLPNDFLLMGNLAHRFVERLYTENAALGWTAKEVLRWLDANFDKTIVEEGAVLLMPGRLADLESFRIRMRAAVADLHERIVRAGARSVRSEALLEGDTELGRMIGSADLLLELDKKRPALIDMKWAGRKKYREKLEKSSHIQLAIYAKLVQLQTGHWPPGAYYVLKESELLTVDAGAFDKGAGGESGMAPVWERLLATYRWRCEQLGRGEIEVVHKDLDEQAAGVPPDGGLEIEPLNPRYNPYLHLAGWESGE